MCTATIDRYDRQLTINGNNHRVSFIPFLQRIVFTNIDNHTGGEFDVLEPIVNDMPDDIILVDEITTHLELASL